MSKVNSKFTYITYRMKPKLHKHVTSSSYNLSFKGVSILTNLTNVNSNLTLNAPQMTTWDLISLPCSIC